MSIAHRGRVLGVGSGVADLGKLGDRERLLEVGRESGRAQLGSFGNLAW